MKCSFNWKDRIPIVKWLPRYTFHSFQCDFIAGITVALMVIPQALAYAVIAGLPTQYGLYSAFMGGFVYCFLGSSKDLAVGPAAIMALMAGAFGQKNDPNFAITLSLFCGIILLFMGFLSLGFIVRLIPVPVVSGFTSAASIIIACEQLPNLLGLTVVSDEFFPLLKETFSNISQTKVWDVVLGVTCMAILEVMRNFSKIEWPSHIEYPPTLPQKIARKFMWVMEIGRNAVVVFACMLIAYAFHCKDSHPFSLTGEVPEGLPPFKVPRLESGDHNTTISTGTMLGDIGAGLVVVPMIAFLTSIAIAQSFSRKNNYQVHPSQELIALGVANVANSFVSGFPIAGCFSRTTVNSMTGVATPFGGVVTGGVVLLALSILTPFFQYIPRATLAAVVIVAVLRTVNIRIIRKIWRIRKIDVVPLVVTFFACLYEIAIGIACGIAVALVILLYRHFLPIVDFQTGEICYVKLDGGLTYMGVQYVITKVREVAILGARKPETVIIDCASMFECDFTVSQGFLQIVQDCEHNEINVILFNARENVKKMLLKDGLPDQLFRNDVDGEFSGLLSNEQEKNGTAFPGKSDPSANTVDT